MSLLGSAPPRSKRRRRRKGPRLGMAGVEKYLRRTVVPFNNPYGSIRVCKAAEFDFAAAGWPSLGDLLEYIDRKSRRRVKQARTVSLPSWGRPPGAAKCLAHRCGCTSVNCATCGGYGWLLIVFVNKPRSPVVLTALPKQETVSP